MRRRGRRSFAERKATLISAPVLAIFCHATFKIVLTSINVGKIDEDVEQEPAHVDGGQPCDQRTGIVSRKAGQRPPKDRFHPGFRIDHSQAP